MASGARHGVSSLKRVWCREHLLDLLCHWNVSAFQQRQSTAFIKRQKQTQPYAPVNEGIRGLGAHSCDRYFTLACEYRLGMYSVMLESVNVSYGARSDQKRNSDFGTYLQQSLMSWHLVSGAQTIIPGALIVYICRSWCIRHAQVGTSVPPYFRNL